MDTEGEATNKGQEGIQVTEVETLKTLQFVTLEPTSRDMDRLVQGVLSVLPRVKSLVYDGNLSVYMEEAIEVK